MFILIINNLQELYHIHKPETVTDQIVMEKKLLEQALKSWNKLDAMGASFSQQVQKDVSLCLLISMGSNINGFDPFHMGYQ